MENLPRQEKGFTGFAALLIDSLQKLIFYHARCPLFSYLEWFRIYLEWGWLSPAFIYRKICTKNDNLWLIRIANISYFAIIRNVRYFWFLLFLRALGCENATKNPQFQKNENSLRLLSCSNANDMSEYDKRMIRKIEEM